MRIYGLPDVWTPVFVELVRVVVKEELVRVEGVLAGFVIADGYDVLLRCVVASRTREDHGDLPIATGYTHRRGLGSDSLGKSLDDHRLSAQQRARRLAVCDPLPCVGVVIHLAARGDPYCRAH